MRKEAGFEVMDHIKVAVKDNQKIADILTANKDQIASKVLADEIMTDASLSVEKEWNINGEKVLLSVEKM